MPSKKRNIILYLLIIIYLSALFYLHYQQLLPNNIQQQKYWSDNPEHLEFSLTGYTYSLNQIAFRFIYPLLGCYGISLFQVVFHALTLYIAYRYILFLSPQSNHTLVALLAFACCIEMPIYLVNRNWYMGSFTGTIYHNSTYTTMQPLALLTIICFFSQKDLLKSLNKHNYKNFILYIVFLTLSTAFKSNFVFCFAPTLLLFLILDFFQTKGSNLKQEIIVGLSVVPSILLCLLQANTLFSDGGSLVWMPFAVIKEWCGDYFCLDLLRSLLFPLLIFLFYFKSYHMQHYYRFSLVLFLVALLEAICLADATRLNHGNLLWGVFIAIMILFLTSLAIFIKELYDKKRVSLMGKLKLIVCSISLTAHILSGIIFFVLILTGRDARL